MKIAFASPYFPKSMNDGLEQLEDYVKKASVANAIIICFPESYIPGYPLAEYNVAKANLTELTAALDKACKIAAEYSVAIILPMDWYEGGKFLNVAFVISSSGKILGYQSKNQLDPSEDDFWDAGNERKIFEVGELKFGIAICHEGFRYPESVRWPATRGASIVFHPHFTGSDTVGQQLTEWGNKNNPYYEKAMIMRAAENTIYFASINYATKYQESATSLIAPDGSCIAYQPYGKAGVLVADIDTTLASGKLAKRFRPEVYQ